jgi:hypothetical protein
VRQADAGDEVTLKERVDEHDRQIVAIRKLILTGMKMINAIAASQQRTETSLLELSNSMKRGQNGRVKRKLDLQ